MVVMLFYFIDPLTLETAFVESSFESLIRVENFISKFFLSNFCFLIVKNCSLILFLFCFNKF